MNPEVSKAAKLLRVGEAFRPAAPVDDLELFAGREKQRNEVISAVGQLGSHIALYGERGIGKTSLARVTAALFNQPGIRRFQAAMVNCHTDDTFESLWGNVFARLGREIDNYTPEGVRFEVEQLDPPALIVIDELDRLESDDALTLLADTIKTLSDNAVPSTMMLVGVATSIDELIGEHESIVRSLAEIEMPRMEPEELRGILVKGCEHAGIGMQTEAIERIVALSEGLPHYTHLLGHRSAERAVQDDRDLVTLDDFEAALPRAIEGHTIQSAYMKAIRSTQPGNLYREVLLACALTPKDNLGYFSSGQIRDQLEVIVGRRLEIPAFSRHMKEFLDPARGGVLRREGKPRRYSYRFSDPMMQPYVIMSALTEGVITTQQLGELQARAQQAASKDGGQTPGKLF